VYIRVDLVWQGNEVDTKLTGLDGTCCSPKRMESRIRNLEYYNGTPLYYH